MTRVGAALGAVLSAHGVAGVYGDALPGVRVTRVRDASTAALLALADARVGARCALTHVAGVLRVFGPGGPQGTGRERVVSDPGEVVDVVRAALADGGGVRLDVDPDAPTPTVPGWTPVAGASGPPVPEGLAERLTAATRPLILAGVGVRAAGATAALRTVAGVAGVGVLNTWAAKGVLTWHSPYHLGTYGLQEDDPAIADLASYDLVIRTGGTDGVGTGVGGVVDLDACALPALAGALSPRTGAPTTDSPLRDRLAAVVQAGWLAYEPPLPPTLLTRHCSLLLAEHGLVAADAGIAGFFLGRTFPTLAPGSVVLPPALAPPAGFAAAAVLVTRSRDPWRPALALVDATATGGPDAATEAVRELARAWGVSVPVACWSPGGPALGADAHPERLFQAIHGGTGEVVHVGYDVAAFAELVAVAGRVSAWGDPAAPGSVSLQQTHPRGEFT